MYVVFTLVLWCVPFNIRSTSTACKSMAILKLGRNIGFFAFRHVPCRDYEYWKVGKSRIGMGTMKLRSADVRTKFVRVNNLRFWNLKIYSA